MKFAKKLMQLAAAVAAVAGIAYLVVTYMDTIKAWLQKVCPCCNEVPPVEETPVEEVPAAEEVPVEEAPAKDAAVEEAPVEIEVPVAEGEPVADDADFEA